MGFANGSAAADTEIVSQRPRLLSGMVICLNEEKRIADCLDSLSFCDEIVVVDSGSTDRTQEIVQQKGARLLIREFDSYNYQKDYARTECRGEWVLNIDADEVVSPDLAQEILANIREAPEGIDGFTIPFKTHFRDLWVSSCGYYPDRHLRLARKEKAFWDGQIPVHDKVVLQGASKALQQPMLHYSFESLDDFLKKSAHYAQGFALAAHRRGKKSSVSQIFIHTCWRFFRAYLIQGGIKQGVLGLTIAGLQAYEVFQKYARLWEYNHFGVPPSREEK